MRCKVSNKLYFTDYDRDFESWCRSFLTIDNPDYYKKEKLGKWVGGTPREISLYEKVGNELQIPFGCLRYLYQRYATECEFKPEFSPIRGFSYLSDINLYEYQEKAVKEALNKKQGILVMPCGSGKTQCGLEIISRIGGRALWLTHTSDLLNQSKSRAQSVFRCGNNAYGTITGGKVNISEGITFATIQTMAKLDLSAYRDAWDIIIVDECQHCAGTPTRVTQFYKVVSALNARYKIGLTATPHRADGLEKSMYALLGETIHEVTKEEVAHTTCPVKVKIVETHYMPDYDVVLAGDGTINYASLVNDLIGNEDRYEVVFSKIAECSQMGPTLVLANRVEYLKKLNDDFKSGQWGESICLSSMGASKQARQARKDALNALNSGELDVVFATYQLAKEGLDVPNLRYVVFATPEKDSTTVMQSVGRVGRKADDKEFGTVIDFDDDFAMYKGWLKKRKGYYKKLGCHDLT